VSKPPKVPPKKVSQHHLQPSPKKSIQHLQPSPKKSRSLPSLQRSVATRNKPPPPPPESHHNSRNNSDAESKENKPEFNNNHGRQGNNNRREFNNNEIKNNRNYNNRKYDSREESDGESVVAIKAAFSMLPPAKAKTIHRSSSADDELISRRRDAAPYEIKTTEGRRDPPRRGQRSDPSSSYGGDGRRETVKERRSDPSSSYSIGGRDPSSDRLGGRNSELRSLEKHARVQQQPANGRAQKTGRLMFSP
jgi:hypothetical protein